MGLAGFLLLMFKLLLQRTYRARSGGYAPQTSTWASRSVREGRDLPLSCLARPDLLCVLGGG